MIRNLYRYLVAVALISVLAAVAGCSSGTAVQGMIEAPVLVGVSLREAEAKAAEVGVQVKVQSSETSDTMPVDFVLRQDPEPQTVVQKGRVITVVTSSGPVSLTLPDFVGGKFEAAQAFIVANQLVLGGLVEQVDASPVGTVLAQEPAGNADVDGGSVVTLTISRGTMAAMPDLVGLSLTESKKHLGALGLSVSKVIVSAQTTQPAQLVLRQEPAAGDAIEKGGWIELMVSKVP
ncbi:PASTA domain-containing protein [Candidatus Cryosericum septentrionale]|jgi:beta-lactam-binding protein with PASTA domain|nr:PASTA domain-containing protein [Candidatus Cryosericum septentrionale]